MRRAATRFGLVIALGCLAMLGCSTKQGGPPAIEAEHAHVHGPHGGELIELGEEEYHAELVHDDEAKMVTIYLLDKAGNNPLATTAPEITITMTMSGTATQFKLPAKPMEQDTLGQSSRFVSTDPNLGLALDNETAQRELSVPIGDETYTAKFLHYEGHHHAHGHDEKSDHDAAPK